MKRPRILVVGSMVMLPLDTGEKRTFARLLLTVGAA